MSLSSSSFFADTSGQVSTVVEQVSFFSTYQFYLFVILLITSLRKPLKSEKLFVL